MQSWGRVGKVMMMAKRLTTKVRFMQRWWRECRAWLLTTKHKLSKRFKAMEVAQITMEFKRRSTTQLLSLQERVELACMSEEQRLEFLTHELRYRRYMILPRLVYYKQELVEYHKEVEEWRNEKMACQAMGVPNLMPIPIRPPYPSYLPYQDSDLMEMTQRTRRNPKNFHRIATRDMGPGQVAFAPQRKSDQGQAGEGRRASKVITAKTVDEAFNSFPMSFAEDPETPYVEPTRGQPYRVAFPSSACVYQQLKGQLTTPRGISTSASSQVITAGQPPAAIQRPNTAPAVQPAQQMIGDRKERSTTFLTATDT